MLFFVEFGPQEGLLTAISNRHLKSAPSAEILRFRTDAFGVDRTHGRTDARTRVFFYKGGIEFLRGFCFIHVPLKGALQ